MKNRYGVLAALVFILFISPSGFCQETFEIQKPEQAAELFLSIDRAGEGVDFGGG